MPWPITFRGERPADPRVGDAYFVPEAHVRRHVDHGYPLAWALALTKAFELAGRRPIAVVLPCGYHLCIDTAYWGGRGVRIRSASAGPSTSRDRSSRARSST
jgi:hypothetical protein